MPDGRPRAPVGVSLAGLRLDELLSELQERLNEIGKTRDRLQGLLDAVVAVGAGLELAGTLQRIVQAALALELADKQRQQRTLDLLADRDRIAGDPHDHVIQRLFAAGMSLQAIVGRISDGETRGRPVQRQQRDGGEPGGDRGGQHRQRRTRLSSNGFPSSTRCRCVGRT